MIVEIALGIVLAVVILMLLPLLITFGLVALVAALVVGALLLAWAVASNANWSYDDAAAIAIFAGIAIAVVGLVKAGDFVERRTQKKIREGEFICIAIFGPMLAYLLFLVGHDLLDPTRRDYLLPRLLGVVSATLPLGLVGWRIRQRYR